MGLYPDDISQRVRRLELITERLFTAINTLPSQVQIGSSDGPHIVFAIGEDNLPEVKFYPDSGSGYARIVAGGLSGAGIEIVGEADVTGNRYSVLIDQDSFKAFFMDPDGTQIEGTVVQATSTDADFGFVGTASSDRNYFHMDGTNTFHVGNWPNGDANAIWGILTGSGSTSGTFATLTYPVTMSSSMNPIVGFQSTAANFNWCITANSTTGFTVSRSTSGSIDLYYWVFRT